MGKPEDPYIQSGIHRLGSKMWKWTRQSWFQMWRWLISAIEWVVCVLRWPDRARETPTMAQVPGNSSTGDCAHMRSCPVENTQNRVPPCPDTQQRWPCCCHLCELMGLFQVSWRQDHYLVPILSHPVLRAHRLAVWGNSLFPLGE